MSDATRQVKFTIESGIVSAFKSRCAKEGVSMASAVRGFMEGRQPAKGAGPKISTRPLRRKAVAAAVALLGDIMGLEEEYRDSIPEQFEQRIEDADHSCEQLAEAIAYLEEAY